MIAVIVFLLEGGLPVDRPGVDKDAAVPRRCDELGGLRALGAVVEGAQRVDPVGEGLQVGGVVQAAVGGAVQLADRDFGHHFADLLDLRVGEGDEDDPVFHPAAVDDLSHRLDHGGVGALELDDVDDVVIRVRLVRRGEELLEGGHLVAFLGGSDREGQALQHVLGGLGDV